MIRKKKEKLKERKEDRSKRKKRRKARTERKRKKRIKEERQRISIETVVGMGWNGIVEHLVPWRYRDGMG